jgi:hypothetical protein
MMNVKKSKKKFPMDIERKVMPDVVVEEEEEREEEFDKANEE